MSKSIKISRSSSSSSTGVFTISSSRNQVLHQSGARKHKVHRVCCKSGGLTVTRVARPLVEETSQTSWSYHPNELFQHRKKQGIVELEKKGMLNLRPIMEESVRDLYRSMKLYWPDCFNFADLGCSLGPNVDAISPFPEIVESIYYGECRLILDLLAHDISPPTIPCFVPKSESPQCHGRLFPDNSVHFLHSSYHLNWLSQVPKRLVSEEMANKGNICVAKGSPIRVQGAYSNQFETDLFDFLRSRSHEIVPGGRMLMSFMGTNHNKAPNIWELLGTTLDDMMMEGLLEESTLDSLNIPLYAPCFEELRVAIMTEGSFRLARHETIEMNFNGNRKRNRVIDGGDEIIIGAQAMMKTLKTAGEVFFKDRLGNEIVSVLFRRHANKVASYLKTHEGLWTNHVVSLIKD